MILYDRIYIGSGPISVADAYYASSRGEAVLVLDEKEQPGGAWVAIPVGDYGKLEIGCHIWSYNKSAYDFMRSFFQLDLIELSPQPCFLKGKTKLIYDHKNAITTVKYGFRHLSKGNFAGLTDYLRKNPAARFPLIPKKYLYPKGGARDLQLAVERKIRESEIELNLTTRVVELQKEKDVWILKTDDQREFQAKNITLTATSAVKKIECNGKQVELEHRLLNYTHFHLVIEGKLAKPCSYIRVLNHPVIHRISDITYQLEEQQNENQTVMLVGVFDRNLPDDQGNDTVIQEIMDYMIMQGLIEESATVSFAQKNTFETTYISPEQIKSINEWNEEIEILSTTDLMYGVHYRLPEWNKMTTT